MNLQVKSAVRKAAVVAAGSLVVAIALLAGIILVKAISRAELQAPAPTLLLEDRQQRFIAELSPTPDSGYGYWPIAVWPERVVNATLALEDKRFWRHHGIDAFAIVRALWQNFSHHRRISGASTIAMQIARMQNPAPRTYFNKSVEAVTAVLITLRYGRGEIIRHYLKIVPYANQFHGIAYAAVRYFNKPVEDLSWAEIALLSAIPPSPTHNNPLNFSGRWRAKTRARRILAQLYKNKLIGAAQYELARQQLPTLNFPQPGLRPNDLIHGILKLQRVVRQGRRPAAKGPLLRVQTTLSLPLQNQVQRLANGLLQQWKQAGAEQVAAIVLKSNSNEVLAWLGSADYFVSGSGAIDYTQVPRSPGSALKPFIYGLGLERGVITPLTVLADVPAVARGTRNGDNRFLGPLLPRQALANSRNVPAINLLRRIGIDEAYLFLRNLHLHAGERPARYFGAGIAIGALPVTLEHLVAAYSVLANDGVYQDLRWYQGQPLEAGRRVMSQDVAREISLFLSDPMARLPSFPRMGTTEYPFPVAVKTGTSQGFRDGWALAYTRDYIVGVWVGRSDAMPMRKLGGAGSAADLAQKILLYLYKGQSNFEERLSFPPPDRFKAVTVCAYTGKRATANCPEKLVEWVAPEALPEYDDSFRRLPVDKRNGLLAASWTPERYKEPRIYAKLPFIYQQWGKSKGLQPPPESYSLLNKPENIAEAPEIENARLVSQYRSPDRRDPPPLKLKVIAPDDETHIQMLPDVPEHMNTLAFNIDVNASIDEILWYVDGQPYKLQSAPFTLNWPLVAGVHRIYAEVPYRGAKSNTVRVYVRK